MCGLAGEMDKVYKLVILYHFDQFDSHASQTPLSKFKSVLVMHHQGLCQVDPTCDKTEIPKFSSEVGRFGMFLYFLPPAAKGCPNSLQNASKTVILRLVRPYKCQNFYLVTVTGHWCQSVELIQHVTFTGKCQIDQNGTVAEKGMVNVN
jgi:hypothetical protein